MPTKENSLTEEDKRAMLREEAKLMEEFRQMEEGTFELAPDEPGRRFIVDMEGTTFIRAR
jgi:hypothetical protein